MAHLLLHFVPIFLYTELHYRFRFFPFSRYYRKEPEIIADAPHRLEPGKELPILILVKDAHLFPVHLKSVEVSIRDEGGNGNQLFFEKNVQIADLWWYEILYVNVEGMTGYCWIDVTFDYVVRGKAKRCVNVNLPRSQESLVVYLSSSSLPGTEEGWVWGELHCHSTMTEDFVEFGAPVEAIQKASEALGLAFAVITDHSYDLDNKPGLWDESDSQLPKWKELMATIDVLNEKGTPLLIPGEEVSTSSSKNKNVHTLVINHPEFIPGSGDGAERWFRTRSELSIRNMVQRIHKDSLVIAAHPTVAWGWLPRILLTRGPWEDEDCRLGGVAGLQILNGKVNDEFHRGLKKWRELLLEGHKKFIYAGSDAHGNLNLYRQVKLPMVSLEVNRNQILGECRTGFYSPEKPTLRSIISALRRGKCVISNGPLAWVRLKNETSSVTSGESIQGSQIEVQIDSVSSQEFGQLKNVRIRLGDLDRREEETVFTRTFENGQYRARSSIQLHMSDRKGYVRVELSSSTSDGNESICYTNPIWINS